MLRRIPLIVIALGLSFASPVFCVDPNRLISQYARTSWRVQDGFEVGTTIAQTPDGYLWLQTPEGLFPFDGVRFVPFDLLESELFGHEKGAFTGALAQKMGRFEMADTGTLFLDEIGDIPLALQPKLLRVLQEKEFERLGSGKSHHVDVRLVSATHRNLSEMVARNQFRSDLYYCLNVFPVVVPPLRERREDIALLVSHFVELFSRRMGKRINSIPIEILDLFTAYSWPGNVRELQNLIERAVIGSQNEILENPFSALNANSPDSNPVNIDTLMLTYARAGMFLEAQRAMILRALRACGWVVGGPRGAAARLGLPRTTLISKMKKLRISRPARLTETNTMNADFNVQY